VVIEYKVLNGVFDNIIDTIDIPNSYYDKAVTSYRSLSNYLADNEQLRRFGIEIYLQGSFKLGTVINPIVEDAAYDVDIVCNHNNLSKRSISQDQLKQMIGKEILEYSKIHAMENSPKNGNRCWTIEYVDEVNFHIDILPSLDETKQFLNQLYSMNIESPSRQNYIAITDKSKDNYNDIDNDWGVSNPKGYADWFFKIANYYKKREAFAQFSNKRIEEVKIYEVKTELQRIIQLIKRHRDVYFESHYEDKVSSIIITTLATHAYRDMNKTDDKLESLKYILTNMEKYISASDEKYSLINPTNPLEDFLDKWENNPTLSKEFFKWMNAIKKDVLIYSDNIMYLSNNNIKSLYNSLKVPNSEKNIPTLRNENLITTEIRHHENPKWKMIHTVNVEIKATKQPQNRGARFKEEFSSGDLLKKNLSIRFEAKAQNISNYKVHWQVTNTGDEAINNNCLRGGFYDGETIEGKRIIKESTSYSGSHFIEVYLVKDGVCYGKSKPFIVNII